MVYPLYANLVVTIITRKTSTYPHSIRKAHIKWRSWWRYAWLEMIVSNSI